MKTKKFHLISQNTCVSYYMKSNSQMSIFAWSNFIIGLLLCQVSVDLRFLNVEMIVRSLVRALKPIHITKSKVLRFDQTLFRSVQRQTIPFIFFSNLFLIL